MSDNQHLNRKQQLWMGGLLMLFILTGFGALALSSGTVTAQVTFATNTPPAPDPLRHTPDAPMSQYALRLWIETDLIEVLISQLDHLAAGETSQEVAISLTLNELLQRFPGAPHNPTQRDRLLAALLNAPRGSVDVRLALRPFIVEALNANLAMISTNAENTIIIQGISVRIIPANFDNTDPVDVVLHLRYPADAAADNELLYEDFLPLVRSESQGFTLPSMAVDLPAAPYGDIEHIRLLRVEDLNNSSSAEMALGIDTGDVNNEMLIIGWRGGQLINLIAAEQPLLYAELPEWDLLQGHLMATVYQVESERWDCQSWRTETWEWNANFYRPAMVPITPFYQFETLGCTIFAEEPVFAQSVAETIVLFHELLDGVADHEPGVDRGKMALAMLYYLAGQTDGASAQVGALSGQAAGNDWLSGQIEAFSMATADGMFDPLGVCSALLQQNEAGACDIDQVILRMLNEARISRDTDIARQLIEIGLPVLETTNVSEVGRADRIVVSFNLPGSSWIAFAPTQRDYYVPEVAEPPPGFDVDALPTGFIDPTPALYNTLIIYGDPLGVMNALDNLLRQNPGMMLSPAARYLLAHTYDLMGDRQAARETYYALWSEFPTNTWGQLAGAHLERR
jgi:hypothetical protein